MTSPAHAQDMITMAQRARTVLAGGRTALLTLPCEQARGWVGVIDDGGEPVLMAGTGGRLASAAKNAKRSWVEVPGHAGERLILTGPLRVVPGTTEQIMSRLADLGRTVSTEDGLTDGLSVLALSVDDVVLCLPTVVRDGRPRRWPSATVGRRIDLASYAFAEPDLISAYAPELIEHLNVGHADQMRQLARHALPAALEGDIAGVQVSGLDRYGMDLWRVDGAGAEQVRVAFRQPLVEPRSLGRELRRLLDQSANTSE
ncbi:DUF2470 domain-containing protein [Frankia sp. AiPs1]|uniref:DUF2470 domain-containing protein n=1 Tax=Frankia sp. AiPs1 TaxID=573493 RepID=UPI002042ECFF|nr:DUF2470 domain-containing protein [Frankia sp. AiPs1]MCM3921381.1 DUF2470 domain-containing protein [Frankia sp. AiPs1]